MKRKNIMKRVVTTVMVLIMMLSASIVSMAAGGTGTTGDPYVGEKDHGHADDGSITIHKYDISAWEKSMKEAPGRPSAAEEGYEIKYYPNDAAGKELTAGSRVGYYYLSAADQSADIRQDVYLSDLDKLSNIVFRLQSAIPDSGKDGSTLVSDYTVNGTIDEYGKTENGTMKWSGLPKGYYIITEIQGDSTQGVIAPFVISLPMQDPDNAANELKDIHIYPKNSKKDGPDVEKEYTFNQENGNIIRWKISAEIPDKIEIAKKYNITDIMSSGLGYAENLEVYYMNGSTKVTLALNTDYTVAPIEDLGGGKSKLVIELKEPGMVKLGDAGADRLFAEYDTIVNMTDEQWEELKNGAVNNEVIVDFTNNEGNDFEGGTGPVPVDETSGIEIIKKDGATDQFLKGVTFKVYTKLSGQDVDPASVLKGKNGNDIILTTDENGFAYYYGLGAGTYYLVEESTIGDYKELEGYKVLTITNTMVENGEAAKTTILNYLDNGLTLPKTGGMGTLLFTIVGIALIAAAGMLYIASAKKKKRAK